MNILPQRKNTRLNGFDYSKVGAYFLTICTRNRKNILSRVVGDGALDVPPIQLTPTGKVVEKYILSTIKIPTVTVDRYVIMPNHIHMIIFVDFSESETVDGMSRAPSPTNHVIPHVVSTLKRFCNKELGQNIFQRSFYDHIIRDQKDYETRTKYICENPIRWYCDELYKAEESTATRF